MYLNKIRVIAEIKRISNELETQYSVELNLRNHCFLRIAYDATFQNKWDLKIKRPFTKYANENQLQSAIDLLSIYKFDKKRLLEDNKRSLDFRKKSGKFKNRSTFNFVLIGRIIFKNISQKDKLIQSKINFKML